MNKKETISLGLFLVSILLIGFILFSGINKEVTIKMESGKTFQSEIPANFSVPITLFLMILTGIASLSFYYYISDFSKKATLTNKQRLSVDMLEGDIKKIYLHILEKDECLQKDLVYELGLPKTKVTRILDKLEEKKLIRRVSYGNTNKVVLR
jgi:predicted transcriptional regulator